MVEGEKKRGERKERKKYLKKTGSSVKGNMGDLAILYIFIFYFIFFLITVCAARGKKKAGNVN